jgi:hypothetical protein
VTDDLLRLGPLLRYVDETTAAVWLEVSRPGVVTVRAAAASWTAPTFTVHGHHFALVEVDGLARGSAYEYTVEVDDTPVWPPADSPYPPSRIVTLDLHRDQRIMFGSCRTSVAHDAENNQTHGVDALRAFALELARAPGESRPDMVLFLGDQVYADDTSDEMQAFIKARRSIDEPPGVELKDFEEYCHLYRLAWADEANRWLLSTLPSAMIFDDHDIRDDWNTSASWRAEMEATSWWKDRIVGGLATYWIYQHLGNLSPSERADDEIWQHVLKARADDHTRDLGDVLDAFAARTDSQPDSYRWSYARDLGRVRLVMVDSRAARVLQPDQRSILDASEMRWLDGQLQGGFDHVLIGTSLPYLMTPGLHYLEAWNEAVSTGAWGGWAKGWGEKVRQAIDLEHWAAFQEGFVDVARILLEVAEGGRGDPPATVTFLSGDVHHSYVMEVEGDRPCRILQAVCSPIRNPLPRSVRLISALSAYGVARPFGALFARSAKVPTAPITWRPVAGPWFDNNVALLQVRGRDLEMRWLTGDAPDDAPEEPTLKQVADVTLRGRALRANWPRRRWPRRRSRAVRPRGRASV